MNLKENDRLFGFCVTRIRDNARLGGRLLEMTHEKTGASLVWVDNKEDNKLFSIAFKTLPRDSTGVFHILEHSVLCGSDKFPVKEPFVELLKSSMNTFLNAITFQDKTMYPVSSRNEKDFLNLTEVYLDAVFAPAILTKPEIFYQEGWHIEQAEDGTLSYKGVVFNEMKGAVSGKDNFIGEELLSLVFPDNCYGVNSGGEPANIPDLTYEKFIETYKKHYHPSNARIFLDGDIPLEKTLALIGGYLDRFERSEDLPVYNEQVPRAEEKTVYYSLAEEEAPENKAQLTLGRIVSSWKDPVRSLAIGVLYNAIADSNESPLKKAVIDSGLAQDMEVYLNDDMPQPLLEVNIKNIIDGKAEELLKLVQDTSRAIAEEGIDKESLIAAINSTEYKLKAPEEPSGLIRCIKGCISWLYGGDPMMYIDLDDAFGELRKMVNTDAFEQLLTETMVSSEGLCVLNCLPSHTAAAEKDAREAERLAKIKESWTEEDLKANAELNEKLAAWQQTPDSPENVAKLPQLPLSEVSGEPMICATEETEQGGVRVLYHPVNTRGIVNFNLYFDMADKSFDDIVALAAIGDYLGELPTANYSSLELSKLIKTYIGSLSFKMSVHTFDGDRANATPELMVSCSVLQENLEKALEIIAEILTTTDFSRKDKIKNLVMQADMKARQMPIMAGHAIGRMAVISGYSAEGALSEAMYGGTQLAWSHRLAGEFDSLADSYIALMNRVLKENISRAALTASVTCSEPADISSLINALPTGSPIVKSSPYSAGLAPRTGSKIPALVGFACQGWNMNESGEKYDASLAVAANLLSLDYLWNEVRVQGGAYGTGLSAGYSGDLVSYSYRDPSLKRTIDINAKAPEHLRKFCREKQPLDKFIISTIASTEPLLSPAARGTLADRYVLAGQSYDDIKRRRLQILDTDYDKLMWAADILEQFAEKGAICAVGQDAQLSEFGDLEIRDI